MFKQSMLRSVQALANQACELSSYEQLKSGTGSVSFQAIVSELVSKWPAFLEPSLQVLTLNGFFRVGDTPDMMISCQPITEEEFAVCFQYLLLTGTPRAAGVTAVGQSGFINNTDLFAKFLGYQKLIAHSQVQWRRESTATFCIAGLQNQKWHCWASASLYVTTERRGKTNLNRRPECLRQRMEQPYC